jgi:molecular chaperone HscC
VLLDAIVGIDLGTTHSLVGVFADGRPQLIRNPHGSFLTPSIVGVLEDGQIVVGAPAKDYRVVHPERCSWAFKRLMGIEKKLDLAGKSFTAPELSSLVLRSLKEDAEAQLGHAVTEAVITVPAYFNDFQRKATKRAGELAGLKVRRIINEPTAAALTYGFHDRAAEKKLIVIDLGGGTFDVTLMEIFEGTLEIISTAGESFLGGEDFTDRLVATVLKSIGQQLEQAEVRSPKLVSRLRQECDVAKCRLAEEAEVVVRVPNEQGEIVDEARTVKITREDFASLSTALIDRLKAPIGKTLRDGECDPADIEDIILVGGATRMPVLVDFVRTYFRKEPLCTFNPDEVVALGAAVQAALIRDDSAVNDMVLTDVCPFTLGINISKQFGHQHETGYYLPIIHRNTTIPVSREEIVSTLRTNQLELLLEVYQGESRKVKDNLKLGELKVTGIPPGPAGQPVGVRFTYDLNGILEVEAYVPETGQKFRTVLANHAQDLTDDEVAAAVRKMQQVKFYPRDDVQNQRLLRFVERLVGEIGQHHREQLEEAIDAFEHALASGDRDHFDAARDGLLMMLSSLGVDYDAEYGDETKK